MTERRRKLPPFNKWQPVVLFLVGCGAFIWQVVVEKTDRPILLAVIAAMLGFPLAQTADRLRTPHQPPQPPPETKEES
jgi:hypothetical protein